MLKEILIKLSPKDRDKLKMAFEQGNPQFIILPQHRFIGVNTDAIETLIPEERLGDYRYGSIRQQY